MQIPYMNNKINDSSDFSYILDMIYNKAISTYLDSFNGGY